MLGRNEKDYTMYIISLLLRDANNNRYGSSTSNGVITLDINSFKTYKNVSAICDCLFTFNALALAMSPDDDFRLLRIRMYRSIMYIMEAELFN